MTPNSGTIFVTENGDAGPQQALIPSLSIENLLQQREAVMTLFQEVLEKLQRAHEIADHARLGFPDLSVDEAIRAETVPPLTREAIRATFTQLHESRGEMFEQGVIECFRRLSWDYKTNLPQKFGKRIVVTYLTSHGGANYKQCDELDDLLRVFHLCDGKPEADHRRSCYRLISEAMRATSKWPKLAENDYFSITLYKNQSGHVTFTRPDLIQHLNRVLAKHFPHALAEPT